MDEETELIDAKLHVRTSQTEQGFEPTTPAFTHNQGRNSVQGQEQGEKWRSINHPRAEAPIPARTGWLSLEIV